MDMVSGAAYSHCVPEFVPGYARHVFVEAVTKAFVDEGQPIFRAEDHMYQ
jgi:hypothetical protein